MHSVKKKAKTKDKSAEKRKNQPLKINPKKPDKFLQKMAFELLETND